MWVEGTWLALGALLGIGLLPVFFTFKIEAQERTRVFLTIKLFWGLVSLHFPSRRQSPEKKLKDPQIKQSGKRSGKSILRFILASRQKILVAIRGTLKQLRFQKMRGRFEFGFEDPATTGEILGVVATVGVWLPKHCGLDLAPNFMRKVFRGDAEIVFYVFPLIALFAAVYFWSILAVNFLSFQGSKR